MKKIEDQIFQVPMVANEGSDMILEFFVCKTNEIKPYRDIRELGIVVYEKDKNARESDDYRQLDNIEELDIEQIEELIKYLQKVKKHVKKFNENSTPDYK